MDTARAAQAFTRSAQQDPDNGEAWNNLAAVHLQALDLLRLHMGCMFRCSLTRCIINLLQLHYLNQRF